MGGLLSLLKSDAQVTTDIFVDFEKAKPTAEEQALNNEVIKMMEPSAKHLEALTNYAGCAEQIRKAISSPGKENEADAWAAVCPAVGMLKDFFEFSTVLEQCFLKLLNLLCQDQANVKKSLEKYQATAGLLAKVLTFALDFDDLKMTNPSVQNDFSYYRRTLSRLKMSPDNKELLDSAVVKDELANRMSLFYAYPTPMLNIIVNALTSGIASGTTLKVQAVTEVLYVMVAICHVAVSQNKFEKRETLFFCLRVMVTCIILYDHVHPTGAFAKGSDINVKTHIKLIQTEGGTHAEGLLNALRYTTKHLNDESTPKAVKTMLA